MVWGHAGGPGSRFIHLFHMPIFLIASGHLWKDEYAQTWQSAKKYIKKKVKTLYFPYVFAGIFFTLLHNVFVYMHLADWTKMNMKEMLMACLKVFLFGDAPNGFTMAMWFIRTLFIISIFHLLLGLLTQNLKMKMYVKLAVLVVCILMAGVVKKYSLQLLSFPWRLQNVFLAYLCYDIGIIIKKYNLMKYVCRFKIFICFGCFVVLCLFRNFGSVSMAWGITPSVLLLLVSGTIGWVMLWTLSSFLRGIIGKLLSFIGKNTMPVIIFHLLAFKLVTFIYYLFSEENLQVLSSFPTVQDVNYLWAFYTLIGVIAPLGAKLMWNKMFRLRKAVQK